MKKWMTAALLVLFAATAFAQKNQGTVFEKGTLKELLALADEQDKYLKFCRRSSPCFWISGRNGAGRARSWPSRYFPSKR